VKGEEPHVFLSCVVGEGMREGQSTRAAENVRFEEPYVLCAVPYTTVWDRQREMCGSKNRTFLSSVLWEKVRARKGERAAGHTPSAFPPTSPEKAGWRILAPCNESNSRWAIGMSVQPDASSCLPVGFVDLIGTFNSILEKMKQ